LVDGKYTLLATATDRAGNQGFTPVVTFSIDSSSPNVTISRPIEHSVRRNFPEASGTISDEGGSGIRDVRLRLYRKQNGSVPAGYWAGGNVWDTRYNPERHERPVDGRGRWSCGMPSAGDGMVETGYVMLVTATDEAGNVGQSLSTSFTIDTSGPPVAILNPQHGATMKTLSVISGTVGDDAGGSGLSRLTLQLIRRSDNAFRSANGWVNRAGFLPLTVVGTTWAYSSNVPIDLDEGLYTLQAVATDRSGNRSVHTINITSDSTPPTELTFRSPLGGVASRQLTTVRGTVADNHDGSGIARVDLQIARRSDGKYWTGSAWSGTITNLGTTLTGSLWSRSTGLPTSLDQGLYTLTAVAWDRAGNHSTAITISLTTPDTVANSFAGGATGHTVSGRVATSTGAAIAGVTVQIDAGAGVTTNSAGYFTFNGIAAGRHTLLVTKSGYTFVPAQKTVQVGSSDLSAQNFIGSAP
jgi:hypothetical protein